MFYSPPFLENVTSMAFFLIIFQLSISSHNNGGNVLDRMSNSMCHNVINTRLRFSHSLRQELIMGENQIRRISFRYFL